MIVLRRCLISASLALVTLSVVACGDMSITDNLQRIRYSDSAVDGPVLRIANGEYYLNNETQPFSEADLEARLSQARALGSKVINVRVYPQTLPYYGVVAVNVAAKVGFETATGIANYTDDSSLAARMKWKFFPDADLVALGKQVREEALDPQHDQPIARHVQP